MRYAIAAIILALLVAFVVWYRPALLVYGDSIVAGEGVEHAWPSLLGAAADGKSRRALWDDPDAADRIIRRAPRAVWIAIGTNDYFLNRWNAAKFGEAYGDLLDRIHAGLPHAVIYAQTPLLRVMQQPNMLGSSLADYRAVIVEACRMRPWARCVDGTAILPVTALSDGTHPNEAAQPVYAAFVRAAMTSPDSRTGQFPQTRTRLR